MASTGRKEPVKVRQASDEDSSWSPTVHLDIFWQVQCGGEPGENQEHAERIICPIWPVNIPGSPNKSWTNWLVGRTDRRLSADILNLDMAKQQIMNEWMNGLLYCYVTGVGFILSTPCILIMGYT